jgi:hypothetical protein
MVGTLFELCLSSHAERVSGKTNFTSLRHPSAGLAATGGQSLFDVGQSASPLRMREHHQQRDARR